MAKWHHIQRSFSGGEISPHMLLRQENEFYKRSVSAMINFLPTPQGSAIRMPGSMYLLEVLTGVNPELNARIIPYLTTGNERSLLLFTPANVKLLRNVNERHFQDGLNQLPNPGLGTVTYRKDIVPNSEFSDASSDDWTLTPNQHEGHNGDKWLGAWMNGRELVMSQRYFTNPTHPAENEVSTAEVVANVDVATQYISLDYLVDYFANPSDNQGGFEIKVTISKNSDYSAPVHEDTYTDTQYPVAGAKIEQLLNIDVGAGFTGNLYIRLRAEAISKPDDGMKYSNPQFKAEHFKIWANGEVELTEADVVTPYAAEDLVDLHFVQSPYNPKELVVTHPRHAPHRFYFDTGGGSYVFEAIPFDGDTGTPPTVWSDNNYPATCTSYNGRLILAGGQTFRTDTGDPVATVSETVWGTVVGDWNGFSAITDVEPDDSIELTSIYRSPIQWVFGQKTLLIGAQEMEYSATGDGIFSPGDMGIYLHSTHGSNNVQPAAFGSGVLFPADAGTKLRSMTWTDEQQGWVSEDLTIYRPEACLPHIKRLVRVRNPHQMCWVLKTDGVISIFSMESGLAGWCRYQPNGGAVKDICTMTDEKGRDTVYLLVQRRVDGALHLYLEAIPAYAYTDFWRFNDSYIAFNYETETNTITGLDHLEGQMVQVSTPRKFLGVFEVSSGQVVLLDGEGNADPVNTVVVGLPHHSTIWTLPPETQDPGAKMRFASIAIRTVGSTRPRINDERPADRDPLSPMGSSQPLDYVKDLEVSMSRWDSYQVIEIFENVPYRTEVLGIWGKLASNSL